MEAVMPSMTQMWLPILLSTVAVFIASSLIHMVLPWHKGDFPTMTNEDAVLDALRPLAIPPGDYFLPRPSSREEVRSPAFAEKVARGPVVLMTVMPSGAMSMGRSLGGWFIYVLVVTALAAHVASRNVSSTSPGEHVFHQVALVSFAGYVLALWQMTIWYKRAWNLTIKATVDGLIYAAITGAVFVWLWPR
jgi:hypothetical protein